MSKERSLKKVELGNDCSTEVFQVVIVGAGMAGLTCARELLASCDGIYVTVVEAASVAGGRVRTIPTSPGVDVSCCCLDAGAEFIHGRGHVLWDTIRDLQHRGKLPTMAPIKKDEESLEFEAMEDHFILAFADGGPQDAPTRQGKYGMYYIDDELVMYNDPRIQPLVDVLEAIFDPAKFEQYTDATSVAEALAVNGIPPLTDSLMELCVAGYGNTAGCCDLNQLSMRLLMAFEAHWESNEVEGDYRPTFGLHRVVDAMIQDLQEYNTTASHKFTLRLNTPVERILPDETPPTTLDMAMEQNVKISICLDESGADTPLLLSADAVVVTVPPTRLRQLFNDGDDLSPSKREALTRIGFADRIVKICCKFKSSSLWPPHLQSIIAAGQPIPELWFRLMEHNGAFWVVGYLVSNAANRLVERILAMMQAEEAKLMNRMPSRENCAERIMLRQLSTMFQVPIEEVEKECFVGETLFVDWKEDFPYVQGGYSFAKAGTILGRDIQALAEPMMNGRVLFAGEATNTGACCTVQAAMETGIRAAQEIITTLL